MGKEFVWSMVVDGESKPWICRVDETECVIIEDGQETQRIVIGNPEKKVGILQIDCEVEVYGLSCGFQLENGIPYIKMDGKWKMSETTMKDRQDKFVKTQYLGGMIQFAIGVALCLGVFVLQLVAGDTGKWWFLSIMGSFFAIVGGSQWYAARKEIKGKK